MKKYINSYIDEIRRFIADDMSSSDLSMLEGIIEEFNHKIACFQHERLIHLIVTVLFAILEVLSALSLVITVNILTVVLSILFMVLLVPYILHYFFLENSVQDMYKLRDELIRERNSRDK